MPADKSKTLHHASAEPTSSIFGTTTSASVPIPQRASAEPPSKKIFESNFAFSSSVPFASSLPSNQAQINALLSKALRGELVDTQFFLFSTRSKCAGVATKPRPLFSNDAALAASSEYFHSSLPGKLISDPAFIELSDYSSCEEAISLNDYGYASDSDLDEEEEEPDSRAQGGAKLEFQTSGANGPQRIIPNRRIMVTDTAFKTWEALLFYLYTGEIVFAPLRSQPNGTATPERLRTPVACSPKSMYRLACKIKHELLQVKALAAIRASLTEHNIVHELSSSLPAKFPPILEMEVQSLFQHVATPSVMKDFPILIKKIADTTDVPHGADILIRLHKKIIKQHYSKKVSPPPVPPPADSKTYNIFSDLGSKPVAENRRSVFSDVGSKPEAEKPSAEQPTFLFGAKSSK